MELIFVRRLLLNSVLTVYLWFLLIFLCRISYCLWVGLFLSNSYTFYLLFLSYCIDQHLPYRLNWSNAGREPCMVLVSGKAFTISSLSVTFAVRFVLLDALLYSNKYFLKNHIKESDKNNLLLFIVLRFKKSWVCCIYQMLFFPHIYWWCVFSFIFFMWWITFF